MKNQFVARLTALILASSTCVYAADDHQYEESTNHKKHHIVGDHEQYNDPADYEGMSTGGHNEDHDHNYRADDNATEKRKGDK